jgi:hypothetical protein
MIYFFPTSYPDELLYHLFGRYHKESGNISMFDTLTDLFGTKAAIAVLDFPNKLEYFCDQLIQNSTITPHLLINNHTVFPFYKPFIPKLRAESVIEDMKGNGGKSIHMRLGIMAGGILKAKGFKYCLKCIDNDRHKYGEAYIHRIHQVPGMFFCLEHKEPLKEYCISNDASRFRFLHINDCVLNIEPEKSFKPDYMLSNIMNDIHYIFSNDLSDIDFDYIWRNTYVRLGEKGFLHSKGKINVDKLANEFLDFYSPELLKKYESYFEQDIKPNWFYNMFRDKRHGAHPIRQLLFIRFLFGSMERLVNYDNTYYHPFGEGPWPCLNVAADHYKKDIIHKCEISTHRGKPVGRFICECGFIYTRKGHDSNIKDRYKIGCKKEFGPVWEAVLKEKVISGNYTIDRLSEIMACDTSTVIKYADKLGVKDYLNSKAKVRKDKPKGSHVKQELEETYKKDVIELIESTTNINRNRIRKLLGKEYDWLRRNRTEWFNNNMPKPNSQKRDSALAFKKVDWNQRDIELCAKVRKVLDEILSENKFIRITISYISRKVNYSPLFEHLDKLPLTKALVLENIESNDKFHIRKINTVVEELLKEGKLNKSRIIEACGLMRRSNAIENYINQLLGNNGGNKS